MERRGINLGRCWNKYIIIDIFFYSAEQDATKEAEAVLWLCSRHHKQFLAINFEWYSRNLGWKAAYLSLKEQSGLLKALKQPKFTLSSLFSSIVLSKFLFEHIRIDGEREVTKVTRIYTASKNGWDSEGFHYFYDGSGPTLCLIRSSDNYLAAGFTSIAWTSDHTSV